MKEGKNANQYLRCAQGLAIVVVIETVRLLPNEFFQSFLWLLIRQLVVESERVGAHRLQVKNGSRCGGTVKRTSSVGS